MRLLGLVLLTTFTMSLYASDYASEKMVEKACEKIAQERESRDIAGQPETKAKKAGVNQL